jgi:hypothetical protein
MSLNNMYLNSSDDIQTYRGQIRRVYDSDQIMQCIKTRLLTIRQEWFLDLDAGLPWFTKMVGRNVDLYRVKSYIANSIAGTYGVVEIKEITLDMDNPQRKLDINFKYIDMFDKTITGSI